MTTKKSPNETVIPRLDIVLLIVGTRGDVQPFLALGQALLEKGHRVRLATHETFRQFVRKNGLEFFPLAGDPAELMEFMVKNSGIIPSVSSVAAGDLGKNRHMLTEILASTWRACTEVDDETGRTFTAEAIIANPPSFGHIHCAQKLRIPLHIMFTMPWSPTTAFPHPLMKVDYSRATVERVNMLSYSAIEMFTWSSMRDLVNNFRNEALGLPALHTRQATYMMIEEYVPYTYCWSPSLVPKPDDWAEHINVSGFFFLKSDATANKEQSAELIQFLDLRNEDRDPAKAPIYIGFGSITGHDSKQILHVVLEALEKTGYRALLSGLASDEDKLPKNVLKIGSVSHDWLFPHVSAVCHHGGAGTTAAGLRAGKPTIVVPFFGDQFFWGNVIEKVGVGPRAVPGKDLTVDDLVEAFRFVHEPETKAAAERIRALILEEHGCEEAIRAFHEHLPLARLRSDFQSTYAACYRLKEYQLQISRRVAQVLVLTGRIEERQLALHATRDWPSMFDHRAHLPLHGILKHGQKAAVTIFSETSTGVKQAMNADSCLRRTASVLEGLFVGVGKGLGHLCIGCCSLYGEITDVLDSIPGYYDLYNQSSYHSRPYVVDIDTGIHTAILVLIHGWRDGYTDLLHTPQIAYERHGRLGSIAGGLIGLANSIVKPLAGTLASLTWFFRGIYANVNHEALMDKGLEACTVNTIALEASALEKIASDNFDQMIKRASTISGFSAEECRRMICEFDQIKSQHDRRHPPREAKSE